MIKYLCSLIAFLVLSQGVICGVEEGDKKQFYCMLLEDTCCTRDAYDFNACDTSKIGHLNRLRFTTSGITLNQDMNLVDPENFQERIAAAGLIERLFWTGAEGDGIDMTLFLSPENRAVFMEAVTDSKFDGKIEVEWIVYNYDYKAGKYFKKCHTEKRLFKANLSDKSYVYSTTEPSPKFDKPCLFALEMNLIPVKGERLKYAFRSTKENTRVIE